jgi:ankyrin repeat protein
LAGLMVPYYTSRGTKHINFNIEEEYKGFKNLKIIKMDLFLAAQRGKYHEVKALVKLVNPDFPVIQGWNILHIAVKNNRIRVVKLLLKYININSTTFQGETSLDISCRHGNINMTRFLLSQNAKGKYPMVQACLNQHYYIVLMLYLNGYENPFKYAYGFGDIELYKILEQSGITNTKEFENLADPITLNLIQEYHTLKEVNFPIP